MDRNLYNAAMGGKVDVMEQYSAEQLEGQLTPNNNTILHVAAQFGHVQFAEALLRKCPNTLFSRVNSKGETALHFAAREGYSEVVKALIERAKEVDQGDVESGSTSGVAAKEMLLRAINNEDRDTALHMAVRNCHKEVVKLLTIEDPEFTHPANKADETPLYLAAEGMCESRYFGELVFVILDSCPSPAYSGPGGRTALHAAALFDYRDCEGRIIKRLLDWKKDLIEKKDAQGWTPLHCAARRGNKIGVKWLLEMEKSVGYITTSDKGKTALHISAALDDPGTMEEILLQCPDCWEVVNSKGQNVLHIALEMESLDSVKLIWEQPWSRHLINQKDNRGYTPLHLIAEINPRQKLYFRVTKIVQNIKQFENRPVFNNQNMSPRDVRLFTEEQYLELLETISEKDFVNPRWNIGSGRNIVTTIDPPDNITKRKKAKKELLDDNKIQANHKEKKKSEAENLKKVADTHLIVATLIATVTFAASFTMPGGYNSNVDTSRQGTPLLLKEAAFKAFVVTNTIALICSTSSVFLYMIAASYGIEKDDNRLDKQAKRYALALILNLIAVAAMVITFITGSYSMLSHGRAVAVSICVIACFSFLIYFSEIIKIKNLVGFVLYYYFHSQTTII